MLSSIENNYVIILGERKQTSKIWIMITIMLINIHGKKVLESLCSIPIGILE